MFGRTKTGDFVNGIVSTDSTPERIKGKPNKIWKDQRRKLVLK